jgi:hypothetical protein
MNYRKVYSKLIRLGKVKTVEGAMARSMAQKIKENKLDGKKQHRNRKGEEAEWKNLDKIIRDQEFYNYRYSPIERIAQDSATQPWFRNETEKGLICKRCTQGKGDYPILRQGGDSYRKPLICPVCGTLHNKNGTVKDDPARDPGTVPDGDPSNPGNYQNQNRRMDGSLKQPTKPTVPPGKPVPKPLPGQQPPFGTPKNPRVVP